MKVMIEKQVFAVMSDNLTECVLIPDALILNPVSELQQWRLAPTQLNPQDSDLKARSLGCSSC